MLRVQGMGDAVEEAGRDKDVRGRRSKDSLQKRESLLISLTSTNLYIEE